MGDTFLITGGAGFIGSNLVRHALAQTDHHIVVLDKLTYAANPLSVEEFRRHPRVTLIVDDIASATAVGEIFRTHQPLGVFNLAAETHVDRSIDGPGAFIDTNIRGTFVLLEAARAYAAGLSGEQQSKFRFLHVSTDEVYGSLGAEGHFREEDRKSTRLNSSPPGSHRDCIYLRAAFSLPL